MRACLLPLFATIVAYCAASLWSYCAASLWPYCDASLRYHYLRQASQGASVGQILLLECKYKDQTKNTLLRANYDAAIEQLMMTAGQCSGIRAQRRRHCQVAGRLGSKGCTRGWLGTEVVDTITDAELVLKDRASLDRPYQPTKSFLFLGSTGVARPSSSRPSPRNCLITRTCWCA